MGTTSEKLTYLNTTKGLIKDNLNLGGANITTEPFRSYSSKLMGIYKDFLANGTDTLWNNWEKVNGTGETLSLTPTIKGKMKIDLKGNTSQNGIPTPDTPIDIQVVSGDNTIKVEGKNLFDVSKITEESINVNTGEKSTNIYYRLSDYIKVLPNTDYISSWVNEESPYSLVKILYYDSNKTFISGISSGGASRTSYGFTTPTNTAYIRYNYLVIVNDNPAPRKDIQIEKGSTATTYTPYVAQTYPINLGSMELCKIGDYQDYIRKSTGKNLFDKDNATLISQTFNSNTRWGYKLPKANNDFYFSKSIDDGHTYVIVEDINGSLTSKFYLSTTPQLVTNSTNDFYILCTATSNQATAQNYFDSINFMMSYNNIPYEPYGKVWYKYGAIGKVVLDGTNNTFASKSGTSNNIMYSTSVISNIKRPSGGAVVSSFLSTHNISKAPNTLYLNNTLGTGINTDGSIAYAFGLSSTLTTKELANTWLSSNNVTCYYPLETPTYTQITDNTLLEQLNDLEKANSYDNQTNVSQTNNDKPFILDLTALKEI